MPSCVPLHRPSDYQAELNHEPDRGDYGDGEQSLSESGGQVDWVHDVLQSVS